MNTYEKMAELIAKVTEYLASLVLGSVAAVLLLQVILRFFFKTGIYWAEEFARFGIIWSVLLVANALIKDDELISVDFFDYLWPESLIKWRDILYQFIFIIILGVLFYTGWDQAVKNMHSTTSGMQISWFYPYLSIPIGMTLILIQYVFKLIGLIKGGK